MEHPPVHSRQRLHIVSLGEHRTLRRPLFVVNNPDQQVLTRSYFIGVLTHILSLNIDASQYDRHSFRKGAATVCAKNRLEDNLMKTIGRWSSDCYQRYICIDQKTLRDAQVAMALPPQ